MNSAKIRENFLDYFRAKDHEVVPSAPMVIKNDPTLMFTNAGMNQFKDLFLGNAPVNYPRVADTQKCLRVSGKHNDLEEVGVDTYHHTMFEMLGNWSFGDYFKKEAIQWAWQLLTEVYKIPKDRLYVTVFEGSKEDHLAFDQEAYDCWKKYIAEDRIINGNKKDNFWEMGDTGPCGPCSEIHVDIRDKSEINVLDGKLLVNKGHPQVIEIWNNVFMEFNRKADGTLEKLPAQHVDTGMGFERLCMVLQGKKSSYDTDIFQPLIQKIEDISGLRYKSDDSNKQAQIVNIAMRVIADHIRAISFSIADGQLPSNTGAGYVIRRILRRAVRYGYQSLGLKEPFIHRLVPVLAHQMGKAFPELNTQKLLIEKVIKEEEVSFFRTLETGLKKIDAVCIGIINKEKDKKTIDGQVVFELYDTYGFPVDLTSLIAKGYGLEIDEKGFKNELEKQKTRSREAGIVDTDDWVMTGKKEKPTRFVGYSELECEAEIVKYRKVKTKGKELFQLVLDNTPFYAESGGQVGDTGTLEIAGEVVNIIDTKKENNLIVHYTDQLPAHTSKVYTAKVNRTKRMFTANNHSATHLLHAALRQVVGKHVEQKGSLVNDEYLRFDFSHFSALTTDELKEVEKKVNEKIWEDIERRVEVMSLDEGKKKGAMALFGEKYGEEVRVVTFDQHFSVELCGGTHVERSGQIGFFMITEETAVAAGIRRIEARTAKGAFEYMHTQFIHPMEKLKDIFKKMPKDIPDALQLVLTDNLQLKKKIELLIKEKAAIIQADLIKRVQHVNGIRFIAEKIELDSAEAIKDISFGLRNELDNLFLVLGAEVKGKPSLSVMISDNLVKEKSWNAGNIVRELAKEINGGGGGQAFYATAGGTNSQGIQKALEKAKNLLS